MAQPFVSRSGQIAIDPTLWRHSRTERKDSLVIYGNGTGDTFTQPQPFHGHVWANTGQDRQG